LTISSFVNYPALQPLLVFSYQSLTAHLKTINQKQPCYPPAAKHRLYRVSCRLQTGKIRFTSIKTPIFGKFIELIVLKIPIYIARTKVNTVFLYQLTVKNT